MTERTEKKERTVRLTDILLGGLALVGTGLGIYAIVQNHRMERIFSDGVERVRKLTSVEVSQAIVDEAVNRAAGAEVSRAVTQIVNRSRDAMAQEIASKVKSAVSEQYGTLSKAVKESIVKKAADIDIDDLRAEVVERAKEAIAERLDSDLDEVIEKYNGELQNVGKIYQAVATLMAGDKAKTGVSLNIG